MLFLLIFFVFSLAGGWLITAGSFRLRLSENPLVGFATGLVVNVWLANVLGHFLPVLLAFWLACGLTLLLGVAVGLTTRPALPRLRDFPWGQFAVLLILISVYYLIGRGLAIFDDYQNLPQVSLLATGDIPPHFALDPSLTFGYHYFLLLLAAQLMRLGALFPTDALDLARAVAFALTLLLAYHWGIRFTRNRVAGFLTAVFVALSGGMRWLLLLIPARFAPAFASSIHLLGTGQSTATDLMTALRSPWIIDGGGPLPFPFAFANGMYRPLVMSLDGVGAMGLMVLLLLLLTHGRWKGWKGASATVVFLAALALLLEVEFLLLYLAFVLVLLIAWIRARRVYLPGNLGPWLGAGLAAGLIALVQGGVFTGIVEALTQRLLHPGATGSSYFSFSFALAWPPSFISAHLGALSLANPYQLIVLLAEVGFIILVFPLVMIWGWKSLRVGRWFEAAFSFMSALSLIVALVHYSGTAGESATLRLYGPFLKPCMLYAVPLTWVWARHRSEAVKITSLSLAGLTLVGGVVMLGFQLIAIQQPVYSYFLSALDAQVAHDYFNRLEPGAVVFDPFPSRAPTILGRPTDSSVSWNQTTPAWRKLLAAPDPHALHAAGFDYALIDKPYWDGLSDSARLSLGDACVKTVFRYESFHKPPASELKDFRWLLDLRGCR